jgi:hypothetical protein
VSSSYGVRDAACPVRTGCTVAQVEFERGVVFCQAGRRDLQPERGRHVELDGHKRRDPGARRQHLRATPGHGARSRRPVTSPRARRGWAGDHSPPPHGTKRTRRVPSPVPSGHAASLPPRAVGLGGGPWSRRPRPTRRKQAPRRRPAEPAATGTRPRARRRPRTWWVEGRVQFLYQGFRTRCGSGRGEGREGGGAPTCRRRRTARGRPRAPRSAPRSCTGKGRQSTCTRTQGLRRRGRSRGRSSRRGGELRRDGSGGSVHTQTERRRGCGWGWSVPAGAALRTGASGPQAVTRAVLHRVPRPAPLAVPRRDRAPRTARVRGRERGRHRGGDVGVVEAGTPAGSLRELRVRPEAHARAERAAACRAVVVGVRRRRDRPKREARARFGGVRVQAAVFEPRRPRREVPAGRATCTRGRGLRRRGGCSGGQGGGGGYP